MKSMTGFGSGIAFDEETGLQFKAELSSVNRKQFELKTSLHHDLASYEIPLRLLIAERIQRGSLNLRAEVVRTKPLPPGDVDFSRALALFKAAEAFSKENNIPGTLTISDLLAVPDAAVVRNTDLSGEKFGKLLFQAVNQAADQLIIMREQEGNILGNAVLQILAGMETVLNEIEPLVKDLPCRQKERLLARLKELNIGIDSSDERFLKEAVIMADRLDVTEEMTRLHCHFAHFRKIASEQGPVGRSLDFLVQEIFREINTLGNKAGSPEVSPKIVFLKNELEKIREQIQNIE